MASRAGETRRDGAEALYRAMADPWSTTIPRRLVHRRSVADVLLTALVPMGATSAVVAAQWARVHPFYAPDGGYHDTTLVLETLRQAGLGLCHQQLGVDLDRQFLLSDLRMRLVDVEQLRVGTEPARLVLHCELDELKWRGSGLRSGRVSALVRRDGQVLAEASSGFTCVDPLAYGRLREKAAAGRPVVHRATCGPVARPIHVGRLREEDVLVCGCGGRGVGAWGVRVDPSHPFLFDHPNDHLPGMALLEACRQAAVLRAQATTPGWWPGDGAITFTGFAPLEGLTTLEVLDTPGGETVVLVRRGEEHLARATFGTLRPARGADPRLTASRA